jgi:hypothetical protein
METKRAVLLHFALIMGSLLVSGLIFATLAEDIVNHETFLHWTLCWVPGC